MKNKKTTNNQGVALLAVLAIMAIGLVIISASIAVSCSTAFFLLDQTSSEKAYRVAEATLEDSILRYVRTRHNMENPYPDWTKECLQIKDGDCKIDFEATPSGARIDAWGRNQDKVRHLRTKLLVGIKGEIYIIERREVID